MGKWSGSELNVMKGEIIDILEGPVAGVVYPLFVSRV